MHRTVSTYGQNRHEVIRRLANATWRQRGAPLGFLLSLRQASNIAALRRARRARLAEVRPILNDTLGVSHLVEMMIDYI